MVTYGNEVSRNLASLFLIEQCTVPNYKCEAANELRVIKSVDSGAGTLGILKIIKKTSILVLII